MQFIHGIDLRDFFPCHNLTLSGQLWSPDAAARADRGLRAAHQPIESISLADLRAGHPGTGVISPRAGHEIIRAGIIRRGQKIANGLGEVELMSTETRQGAIRCSDVELTFEEARRRTAPEAVSRLSCLYLAEATAQGASILRSMLGPDRYLLDVRIGQKINLTRADATWFDAYFEEPDSEYATNYWLGFEKDQGAGQWEYLLDGMIEATDAAQIEHVRLHGAKAYAA